ncbi:hypothetical protein NW762_001176 [Fusarium torreyae]|uniref:Uncharacterized protein n=1 Tax=Fusarium torreyae TaxID=1237075 RepID=A0A9W8SD02_9HYPO|nr:hypothetical protein NW762_001176 [Fusarium torreyae]
MFVYQGKLNWYHYAKDETFVIILPSGPVRVGDSVYLFSQWTVDAQGVKKRNWFDTITVDTVTQTQASDVTFYLKGACVVMRNPQNGVSSPMPLQRIWESDQELTGTTRIWTGKFNWMNFAQGEHAIFIVPDGFGEGKPILSLWQYTKDSAGKLKDPSFRNEVQKSVSGLGSDVVKFSYKSYYDISCTWEAKTDKLAVHVKEGSHGEDVGSMIRSAIIERQVHSHDFDPPETDAPEKCQLECRKPQAQCSLPRILTPLPFPKGLLETLAHTAAFVDQAGYLAKYAQDRFAALDADYHALVQQLKARQADIANLTKTREELTADRDGARAKAKELEKELAKASNEADDLRSEIANLNDYIHKDSEKDEQERNILKETQKKLDDAQVQIKEIKQQLVECHAHGEELKARIDSLLQKIVEQQTIISRLEAALDVQVQRTNELTKENGELKSRTKELESTNTQLQGQLDRYQKRIAELEAKVKEQGDTIDEAINEKDAAQAKVSAAQKARSKAETTLEEYKKKAFEKGLDL